jgi:muramidase (phage lysozyme)
MREVKLSDGRTVQVKSIRWKALRQMEADGLTPNKIAANPEKADEALLRQMEEAGIDEKTRAELFEQGLFSDAVKISRAIWAETYGHEGEEKN